MRSPVRSVRQLNLAVPEAVDQAIAKALAKSAEGRFGIMEEFVGALIR